MNTLKNSLIFTTLLGFFREGGSSDNLIPAGMLKQPSIATTPQTYRVPVGGDAELECKLLNLGDSVQLWKNGTRVISVGSLQVRNDPRIMRSLEKLLIKGVDVWDTGTYTCEIEGDMEEQTTVSHFLQVLEAPTIIGVPGPESMRVRAGTTVSINCKAEGHPTPNITWTKLQSGRTSPLSVRPELTIEEVSRTDGGLYQCCADNRVGEPKFKKISLQVLYPPEVTAVHRTVHASVGWGVNISCDVWSDPPSSLEWFRGTGSMEYLDQHTQFQQMAVDGSLRYSLSLVPQIQIDITNYTCLARNKIGEGKATILLTGLPSPPLVSSGELSASLTSYLLSWHTHSFTDIAAYNILYRKLPSGPIVYAWDSIDLEGEDVNHDRDKTGGIVLQHYKVVNLSPDSAFVAKIKAKNTVGWSDFSREFLFYTQGKDSSPVESHVLGTDEVTSSSFVTENNFQLAMGLLLLLQTLIR